MRPSVVRVGGFAFNGINDLHKYISDNCKVKVRKTELYDIVFKECDKQKIIEKFNNKKKYNKKKLFNDNFWDFK